MRIFDSIGQIIELLLYQDIIDERNCGKVLRKPKPSYTKTSIIKNILCVESNEKYLDYIQTLIDNNCLILDEKRSKRTGRDYYFINEEAICDLYKPTDMCRILEVNHSNYVLS